MSAFDCLGKTEKMDPRVGYFVYNAQALDHCGVVDRLNRRWPISDLAGGNLGNYAFKYGLRKMTSSTVGYFDQSTPPEQVRAEFDVLLVAEANVVNPGIDFGPLADLFEAYGLPVMACGIGSQAPVDVERPEDFPTLKPGTARYLRVLAELAPNLIVRGSFTGEVLREQLGINNVRVGGCPSFFINPATDLWSRIGTAASMGDFSRAPVVTEGYYHIGMMPPQGVELERLLFEVVNKSTADYVIQQNWDLLEVALGLSDTADNAAVERMDALRDYSAPNLSSEEFGALMKDRCKAFVRTDEWITYLRRRTASVGTRIHGSILSLQAETPALAIAHDRRTIELAETLSIPYVSVSDILNLDSPYGIFDLLASAYSNLDVDGMDQSRRRLSIAYKDELNELGVPISADLLDLAH